jgi:hypothetical protein
MNDVAVHNNSVYYGIWCDRLESDASSSVRRWPAQGPAMTGNPRRRDNVASARRRGGPFRAASDEPHKYRRGDAIASTV